MSTQVRQEAFGQGYSLTFVDRFGVWLSARQVKRWVPNFEGLSLLDAGCGFDARLARSFLPQVSKLTLLDVDLAADLDNTPKVDCLRGALPATLERVTDSSLDVVLCLSVLEHLWQPEVALAHFHRVLRPGGKCLINVPSWRGKYFLEYSAFRLGMSPKAEMDDHKAYYDPRDLWPLLVRAGFMPSQIQCFKHKFGLNTFAVVQKKEKA